MPVIKSFAVGNGDMFYIKHGTDNFTIIDCNLTEENAERIIEELKAESKDKGVVRFICTHPDQDHFGGIELLDDAMPIRNFYAVSNQAVKDIETASFERYRALRDGDKAFHIFKGCQRRWMNLSSEERGSAGIQVLWPDTANEHFIEALEACDAGESFNNTSAVIRYAVKDGTSFMWLGDLETEFMESIVNDIELEKTTVVFASHHGRDSGRIPHSWLKKLDPQIIVIGEAPSRHLNYYTGYQTITQNTAGDIVFDADGDKVHIYADHATGVNVKVRKELPPFGGYVGTIAVETLYTLVG